MKREIEFRIWTGEKMIYKPDTKLWLMGMDGILRTVTNGKIEIVEGMEVDWYTGLKDRYGVKIFEGDIVSRPRHSEPDNWASPMVHKKELARTVVFSMGMFVGDDNLCPLKNDAIYGILEDYEVIGNIHQE